MGQVPLPAGVDERVVCMVAHHTAAMLEAEERGLAGVLIGEFELEESPTAGLLWYCDLTTGPQGQRLAVCLSGWRKSS